MNERKVIFEDLGKVSYKEAWDYQTKIHQNLIQNKIENRKRDQMVNLPDYFLMCEHKPVYTLGKSGTVDHLLLSKPELEHKEIEYFKINRGGDITYHGPGQITGYPIFDLDHFFTDVHKYVRYLEEAVIRTIAHYGINGSRIDGFTGVWILSENPTFPHKKICAIGVHLSRWVTMHGFALNVNTDLSYFNNIIPCGIADENKVVTSVAKEIGKNVSLEEVKSLLKDNFAELFDFKFIYK